MIAAKPRVIDTVAAAVDERNPWLGLASFTEETRAFFYGRDDEVAELARRVQRKLLTVLFGQSGLGKTSILRAGLVPRLRSQGYCPIYVRIDYAPDTPEPVEQIKQAINRTAGAGQIILYAYQLTQVVYAQSVVGDASAVSSTLTTCAPFLAKLRQSEPAGSMAPIIFDALCSVGAAQAAYERDDLVAARSTAMEAANRVQASKPARGVQEVQKYVTLFLASNIAGHAEYLLGNYPAAERAQREAIEARKKYLTEAVSDRRDVAEKSTWLAMALARQNRLGEAAEVIAPVVKFHRALAAKNMGDRWQTLELASALYAEALADPKKGAALLREAAALVDGLPATMRPVHDVRQWRERIHQAQQGVG